jgi:hypothetical protein
MSVELVSHLTQAPLDVLAGITAYLTSNEIINLWFCGSGVLNNRLSAGGVRTVVHDFLSQQNKHNSKWPEMLSWMRGLQTLSARFQGGLNLGTVVRHAQLWRLSPTILELDFQFSSAESIWIIDPALVSLDSSLYTPSFVKHDHIEETKRIHHLNVDAVFPQLQKLSLDGISSLPPSFFLHLPNFLTTLVVPWNETINDSVVMQLPPHMTHLDIGRAKSLTNRAISFLPRTLLHLDLRACALLTSKCFKDLPPQLTYLNVAMISECSDTDVSSLPASISEIDLRSALTLTDACSALLPRALKTLNINHHQRLSDAFVVELPKTLRKLNMADNQALTRRCVPDLPPDLDSFVLYFLAHVRSAYYKLRSPPGP